MSTHDTRLYPPPTFAPTRPKSGPNKLKYRFLNGDEWGVMEPGRPRPTKDDVLVLVGLGSHVPAAERPPEASMWWRNPVAVGRFSRNRFLAWVRVLRSYPTPPVPMDAALAGNNLTPALPDEAWVTPADPFDDLIPAPPPALVVLYDFAPAPAFYGLPGFLSGGVSWVGVPGTPAAEVFRRPIKWLNSCEIVLPL